MPNLKLFKSSAGSGKTFTLVKEYLLLVLRAPDDFRAILAITFTNKAAEEMKSRIVEALVELSSGEKDLCTRFWKRTSQIADSGSGGEGIKKHSARLLQFLRIHD
ncbi:MAG: UvrD-helicase domain-containing protein [Bacteroidetes bacterium]|nr:UvrD-helicase domain-containing protein [Bacteroidota bacterium]